MPKFKNYLNSYTKNFEVFKSREIILEVMPKGVHKAVGLKLLSDYLALDKSQVLNWETRKMT